MGYIADKYGSKKLLIIGTSIITIGWIVISIGI